MGSWVRTFSALMGVAVFSLLARSAAANEPLTVGTLQLGAGYRYGLELEETDVNPWGNGLGAEVGHTLPSAVYLGASFEYFFGDAYEHEGSKHDSRFWQPTVEGGYDLALGPAFVIRPKLRAGVASHRGENCGAGTTRECSAQTTRYFVVAPGAKLLFLTDSLSLSADVRYDVVFLDHTTADALVFGAGAGAAF